MAERETRSRRSGSAREEVARPAASESASSGSSQREMPSAASDTASASGSSSRTGTRAASVTDYPGQMHSAAQPVVRNGVTVLTDRPLASDEPLPGRREPGGAL